jgi:NAD(P)H dehydrogenase (quinone)
MGTGNKVTVFGATGRIGQELLSYLSGAGVETIAVSRKEQPALPHVTWVRADLLDKSTLPETMKGSKSVFLNSNMGPAFVEGQLNLMEAAEQAGVPYIVKLSSGAIQEKSAWAVAKMHEQIEVRLKASSIDGIILRPTGFMQNWLGDLASSVKQERTIYEATGLGRRAYIDLRDIAEVAFTVMMQPEQHACHAYFLTGGEALNYQEVADILSRSLGEKVRYEALTEEEAKIYYLSKGLPEWMADTLLAYAEAQRNGQTAQVSEDVRNILRKPARTVEDFVMDHMYAFQ